MMSKKEDVAFLLTVYCAPPPHPTPSENLLRTLQQKTGVISSLKPHKTFCLSLGHKQLEESICDSSDSDPNPQSKCRLPSGMGRGRHPDSRRGRGASKRISLAAQVTVALGTEASCRERWGSPGTPLRLVVNPGRPGSPGVGGVSPGSRQGSLAHSRGELSDHIHLSFSQMSKYCHDPPGSAGSGSVQGSILDPGNTEAEPHLCPHGLHFPSWSPQHMFQRGPWSPSFPQHLLEATLRSLLRKRKIALTIPTSITSVVSVVPGGPVVTGRGGDRRVCSLLKH